MPPAPQRPLPIYLRYPRACGYAALTLWALITSLVNTESALEGMRFQHLSTPTWQPWVWDLSSTVAVLAIVPVIVAFDRWLPIGWSTWRINVVRHSLATVVFHYYKMGGDILLRKLAYAAMGQHYVNALLPNGMGSTYLTDARTYLEILAAIYAYTFILLQLYGEAREFTKPEVGAPVESLERPRRFLVRKLGKEFLIAVDDIERLEAQGNYVNLNVKGHAYPLRSTMSAIEAKLDPNKFVRVHRSHIVNLDCLVEIQPLDTGDASLKVRDGSVVPCSRSYRSALREKAAPEGARTTAGT